MDEDLIEVIEFLSNKGIINTMSEAQKRTAKKIHSATYSLILWRFQIRNLPDNSQVFLDEIASDALQILPQALMGYRKTTVLLIRSVIENVLRHIYFSDHIVEFQLANKQKKWYLSISDNFSYVKSHPIYSDTEIKYDSINKLQTLYDDLSSDVHGRSVSHLEMRKSLSCIKFDQEIFDLQMNLIKRCSECSNFLLLMFHKQRVAKLESEQKGIFLKSIPPIARRIWMGIE